MEFLRCDRCGKPLGEGAIGRGDAVKRGTIVICAGCTTSESLPVDLENNAQSSAPMLCGSCRIPLDAQDFVEGRGFRFPSGVLCYRCLPQDAVKAAGKVKAQPAPTPSGRRKQVIPPPARQSKPSSQRKAAILPRPSDRQARVAANGANGAAATTPPRQRSPFTMAAWLLMLVVLPAFGISLFTAIDAQDERNEIEKARADLERRVKEQETKPQKPVRPNEPKPVSNIPPPEPIRNEPKPPLEPANDFSLPAEARKLLLDHEVELARPLVERLQSEDVGARLAALSVVMRERAIGAAHAVRELLKSEHPAERQMAATTLGALGDGEAILALERAAENDEVTEVRLAARRALTAMAAPGAPMEIDLAGQTLDELRRMEAILAKDASRKDALELVRKAIEGREMSGGVGSNK